MVGSTKDPADGKAVAGSIFAAVVVYVVWYTSSERNWGSGLQSVYDWWMRGELTDLCL